MAIETESEFVQVAIHGSPRSGSTWLGEIFNSVPSVSYKYQPLFSYAFKGFLGSSSSNADITEFFSRLNSASDEFIDQTAARASNSLPTFYKTDRPTHIVYKEVRYHHILPNLVRKSPNTKVCLLIRNPLSVVSSWLNAPREFRKDLGWNPEEEWRYALKKNINRPEEFNGFERWKDATNIFLHLGRMHPDSVIIVEYKKLIEHPRAEVERLFNFCNLPLAQQTIEFILKSQNQPNADAYSVFRARKADDNWKESLPQHIAAAIIDDLAGTSLEPYLYLS